jgi:hypothetical protein
MLAELDSPKRLVSAPRWMVRRLAGWLSRTAVVVAHLIRCRVTPTFTR